MGIELLLILTGVIMQAASDAHSKLWNLGETLWHIGVGIVVLEAVLFIIAGIVGLRETSKRF